VKKLRRLVSRLHDLLDRAEALLPPPPADPDWERCVALRWRRSSRGGHLQPVTHPHRVRLADLRGIDAQKAAVDRNTRQFLAGLPANNVLLWGSRGTGKSSLIKALLNEHAARGLRLVEVDKDHLADLPEIVEPLHGRPERFVLFCDDLSFEAGEPGYKVLKATLDGSLAATPENVLIYATSNRRHLLPEYLAENLEARNVGGEIHHGDAVEEKISLSERFGLWFSFYPFDQDTYLDIVHHWLVVLGVTPEDPQRVRSEALRWALAHGSRSGRAAWQFARDWAGREGLREMR
jgi:predicted AAA+ superfamily ATPase